MKTVLQKLLLPLAVFFISGISFSHAQQVTLSAPDIMPKNALQAIPKESVSLKGQTMGTSYSLRYYPEAQTPEEESVVIGLEKVLQQITDQMSTYEPDSQISRFNQSREAGKPFAVDPEVIEVIQAAQRISSQSGGGLDITVAPLVELWGFGPSVRSKTLPSEQDVQEQLRYTGMDKLQITSQGLVKQVPELSVDLSAIAKGYGVDAVGRYLESLGVKNYLVEIGGEIRVRGQAGERSWRVGIQMPNDDFSVQIQNVVELTDLSMATSGDYHNYYDSDGVRYSHTIDPRTGSPLRTQITSISVFLPECMEADGWTTGLMVLGPEKGIALADELDIPVYMILKTDKGLEVRQSKAFTRLFGSQAPKSAQ